MYQPIWMAFVFQATKTPGLFRLQWSANPSLLSAGPKVGRNAGFSGVPNKGDKTKAQKRQQKAKRKNFHCVAHPTCKHEDCLPWELNQRPSHHRGTIYPLGYGPSLTDVYTRMGLILVQYGFRP